MTIFNPHSINKRIAHRRLRKHRHIHFEHRFIGEKLTDSAQHFAALMQGFNRGTWLPEIFIQRLTPLPTLFSI